MEYGPIGTSGQADADPRGHSPLADFTGWIGSFRDSNGHVVDETRCDYENVFAVSWGQDSACGLYAMCIDGWLYRIEQVG